MATGAEELRKEVERSIEQLNREKIRLEPYNARVNINIHPNALPRASVNPTRLLEGVGKLFGSRLNSEDLLRQLPDNIPRESINPVSLVQMAFETDRPLRFKGGLVRFPDIGRITSIEELGIMREYVYATVTGTSDEALYVAKQLALEVWKAAGLERQWSDLAQYVERQSFDTSTIVDLGFPLSKFLNPKIVALLTSDLIDTNGLAREMGALPTDPVRKKRILDTRNIVPHCRDIGLRFVINDTVSGFSEEIAMGFVIYSTYEANRSRVIVSSELPSDKHGQLVVKFVTALTD